MNNKPSYIIEFLLWAPSVYSGLDHLMVEMCRLAKEQGKQVICVYCDTMQNMPLLEQDIIRAGGQIELVSSNTHQMLRDIRFLYRKYRPEVVDTHFVHPAKLYTQCLSLCFHARHFTHVHSLLGDVQLFQKQKGLFRRFAVGVYYWLQKLCSRRVLCISVAIQTEYFQWGYGSNKKVSVAYVGTPLAPSQHTQQHIREELQLPLQKNIIANVSAIEPIKGIDVIIKALSLLKQQGREVLFVHIGGLRNGTPAEQNYAESLRLLAKELQVENQIVWLGKRADVQDILPLADVYVHPSRSEGLGSVLMEAAVAGLPLIGTRVGGIPEVIREGQTGRLIPPHDPHALAQALTQILDNPTNNLGQQAQTFVFTRFDQTRCAKHLFSTYYA